MPNLLINNVDTGIIASPNPNLPAHKSYQIEAITKAIRLKKFGVIARPGAGKTRIAIDAINSILQLPTRIHKIRPILVVCSGPAVNAWLNQFPYWADVSPAMIQHVDGTQKQRITFWNEACHEGSGIYICNWSIFLRDFHMINMISWSAVIGDEYQRTMRKHKTQTFMKFRSFTRHIPVLAMCSGSPIRKHPATMWTVFALAQPNIYGSYWQFVDKYCQVVETEFRKEIVGPKNIEEFKEILHKHMAFIPSNVIDNELPSGQRLPLYATMDEQQQKVYNELTADLLSVEEGSIVYAQTAMTLALRLKQLLCCPKLLSPEFSYGGGIEAIIDAIKEDPHCVIFVPFREACDLVKEALFELGGYSDVFIIRGGTTPQEQAKLIKQFTATQGIMICTIQFSESFELISASQAYFLGYCYTVDENEQAEGRIQRISSKHPVVFWNYVLYPGSIDDHYIMELGHDFIQQSRVMQIPDRLNIVLKEVPFIPIQE